MLSGDEQRGGSTATLYAREWLIVYLFLFLLLSFAALSFSKKQALIAPTVSIEVTVVGAIEKEKTFSLHPLSTIADVLAQVEVQNDADLDKLIIDERVKPGRMIIPKKGCTSIWVQGAVIRNGVVTVPENCHFNELLNYVLLQKEADIRFFTRKRRLVVEGEEIVVPRKV